ncbi:hypothetical protein S144_47 [Shewanella sp. phage 1/44]|uniref:hypothetical protein n=1 Tax=Shewanella sp. phage 1/44 TaxID=1458862 RepID=UPI0004F591A9|nr:hypothetical protein S144_47 [Shewanella sp. phage 1/44]AHK11761.1 hypothetical protein S144_47 [Shewanella sp. phage 1/44]
MPTKPVLMSANNHDGWTLEDLLKQIQLELDEKTKRLDGDMTTPACRVASNNYTMMRKLAECEKLQSLNVAILNSIGPNPGPSGTPRIGVK